VFAVLHSDQELGTTADEMFADAGSCQVVSSFHIWLHAWEFELHITIKTADNTADIQLTTRDRSCADHPFD
jgi:hypothetical protein